MGSRGRRTEELGCEERGKTGTGEMAVRLESVEGDPDDVRARGWLRMRRTLCTSAASDKAKWGFLSQPSREKDEEQCHQLEKHGI